MNKINKKYSNLNILLVGAAGKFGTHYLKSLTKDLDVAAKNITAVDVDAKKLLGLKKEYPEINVFNVLDEAILNEKKFDCVLITANTPSHHKIIIHCMKQGIKNIFVEKPLAINIKAAQEIKKRIKDEKIFTAFIGNFSDSQKKVMGMMEQNNLYLNEAFVLWSKDRAGDDRPTPGSLDDESVHGLMAVYVYATINQDIRSMKIQARLSHLDFVNKLAQQKARSIDDSMPEKPVSTAFITQEYLTGNGPMLVGMRCTFLGPRKNRLIHLTLSDAMTHQPKYLVEIDSSDLENILRIKKVAKNESETKTYYHVSNKITAEIAAFLDVVIGKKVDSRLIDFKTAMLSMEITEAARKSDGKKGASVRVF